MHGELVVATREIPVFGFVSDSDPPMLDFERIGSFGTNEIVASRLVETLDERRRRVPSLELGFSRHAGSYQSETGSAGA